MDKEVEDEDFSIELCPGCLNENKPGTHFCGKCGSPLSTFAATAPWERIEAERHIYANAASNPRKIISLIGIWLIFGNMFWMGTFLVIMVFPGLIENEISELIGPALDHIVLGIVAGGFFAFVGGYVTIRTTVNYFKLKKREVDC